MGELNFFRDDPQLFSLIREHAGSSELPDWPYAAALLLQRACAGEDTEWKRAEENTATSDQRQEEETA